MRERFIVCWQRSAAPISSDPRANSIPAHFIARGRGMNLALRLISIALLLAVWFAGSHLVGTRLFPEPQTVGLAIAQEARSGALFFNLGITLARVAVAFTIAMALGTALGLAMGRVPLLISSRIPGWWCCSICLRW